MALARPGMVVTWGALVASGCGRLAYATGDASSLDASTDVSSPLDATAPDAVLDPDATPSPDGFAALDAFPLDAAEPADAAPLDAPSPSDAFSPPDAVVPGPFVVTNGEAAGPGSLQAALDAANASCPPSARIEFDVPTSDPRFEARGFLRIPTPVGGAYTITCAGLTVDGTSQTAARGNSNGVTLGGTLTVGAGRASFAGIPGPEVQLANTIIDVVADDVGLRGLAFTSLGAHGAGLVVEGSVIGGEPDALVAEAGRAHLWGAYVDGTATTLRGVAVVGAAVPTDENLVVFDGGMASLEDVALLPAPTTASIYDVLHVRAGAVVGVVRSFIDAGATYEVALEASASSRVAVALSTLRGGTLHAARFTASATGGLQSSALTGAAGAALFVEAGARVSLEASVFGDSGGAAIELEGATESPSSTDCGYEVAGSAGLDRPLLVRGGGGVLLASGCPGATVTVGVADPLRGDSLGGELVASSAPPPLYTLTLDAAGRASSMGIIPAWIVSENLVAYQTDAIGNSSMLSANLAP